MKTESQSTGNRQLRFWLAFAVVAMLALGGAFFADAAVLRWVQAQSSPMLKHWMGWVSKIGDWPAHVALGLILAGLAWWRGSKRWLRVFLAMLLACALAGAAARVIKIAAGRARPSVETYAGWNGPRFTSKYHSFPSGHTASSTAFFVALLLARPRVGAPLLLIPLAIACSRLFVGAHYLSDIVFAATIGVLCGVFAWRWMAPSERRLSAEAEGGR